MNKPLLSFVMPTRNREQYIGQAIQSIIDQTETNWELIVIDDHSAADDQTEQIVTDFNDSRIRYYRLPDIFGQNSPSARNFGNALAKADIIAVCDSDDIYFPERAALTIKAFNETNCDVVYGQMDVLDEATGEVRERAAQVPVVDFNLETLKNYDFIPHGSSAYRRSIALEFPYNNFFRRAGDYDLFSRLAMAGKKFTYIPSKLFRYRLHDSNISGGGSHKGFDRFIAQNRGWATADEINGSDLL
jgi:glycosyltransferase involved in cell wall biosynthesis